MSVLVAIVGALLLRASPLILGSDALRWQFISDDGYYALTVANNLAAGRGLTIDGINLTNGFQPAAVFLFSLAFKCSQGHLDSGLRYIVVMQLLTSLIGVVALLNLVLPLIERPYRLGTGVLFTLFWLCSPRTCLAEMSGMETGLYIVALSYASAVYMREKRQRAPGTWPVSACIGMGCVLALVFYVRNDGVFLTVAVIIWHLLKGHPRRHALYESLLIGSTALLSVSPWLLYNYWLGGSIVPISGHAEALDANIGGNALRASVILLEMPLLVLKSPIRHGAVVALTGFHHWWLFPLSGGILILAALLSRRVARPIFAKVWRAGTTAHIGFSLLYLAFLILFYSLFFGAPWHLDRFLLPVQVVATAIASSFLGYFWKTKVHPRGRLLLGGVLGVVLVVSAGYSWYMTKKVHSLPPFSFTQYRVVRSRQMECLRLGAMNSGALGFFFDDVVNLDGKVNRDALAARRQGELGAYVVHMGIDAVVDLNNAVHQLWEEDTIRSQFDLVRWNLPSGISVLVRKDLMSAQPTLTPGFGRSSAPSS